MFQDFCSKFTLGFFLNSKQFFVDLAQKGKAKNFASHLEQASWQLDHNISKAELQLFSSYESR